MLISDDFESVIRKTGVDEKFLTALSDAYQDFSKQIMMELTLFSYDPSKYGFADLNLVSREYAIQKYFEPLLESYIRQFFVRSFFERVLKNRGYDVYTPIYEIQGNQYVDGEVVKTNIEFEKKVGFVFVIDNETERIGFRLTDIYSSEAEKWLQSGMVSRIVIIDWYSIDGIDEDEKKRRTYGTTGKIDILGIREFIRKWLGDAECVAYELFIRKTIQNYQEIIGITSLPKLTAPVLFEHRLEEERIVLKRNIEDLQLFSSIEKKNSELPENQRRDTHFGYLIIDAENFKTFYEKQYSNNIESRSKKLISNSGIVDTYFERKLFKALVGKSDFAKSFLTSEYLYSQYNENDLFDYTAIVSGYLKSIEQLLTTIVFGFADKAIFEGESKIIYRIRCNRKKKADGSFPASYREEKCGRSKVGKIDLNTEDLECVDTSIGSLIWFIKDYKQSLLNVEIAYRETIIHCLECYRIECRNSSFHTHNNYDWEKVKMIRHNTLLLYIMILGGFRLDLDDAMLQKQFDIVSNDSLERVYYWLRKMHMYSFRVKFKDDESYYLATRRAENTFPVFDDNGLLCDDFEIKLDCKKENSSEKNNYCFSINRNDIPEEIWCMTYMESYPIDFDQ